MAAPRAYVRRHHRPRRSSLINRGTSLIGTHNSPCQSSTTT